MNSAYLWSRARLAVNKKQNYFSLPDHQLAENLIRFFFWFLQKDKKGITVNLTTFVEIIVTIIFFVKISLKFLVKSFQDSVFSPITWNTKPRTKQFLERPKQILGNCAKISWRALQLLYFFEAFRISWFICQSIFGHFQILLIWFLNYFYVSAI